MDVCTYRRPKAPFILIPLYIYPLRKGETWAPVFEAVRRYPDLSFVVVVNPDSGPGQGPALDENYLAVLRTLLAFNNVTILGYVAVCWAERKFDEVAQDVRAYYHWERVPHHGPDKGDYDDSPVSGLLLFEICDGFQGVKAQYITTLRIDGIFFDEAPSKTTEENVGYMSRAAKLARSLARSPDRSWNNNQRHRAEHGHLQSQAPSSPCTIISNPGTPPSHLSPFFDSSTQADYIVVFEQTLATWPRPPITPELNNPLAESDADADPFSELENTDPCESENRNGREYIASCLASLSPAERAQSIAIAHSVTSLADQLRFASEAVGYGLAGHFATSSGDYSSWSSPSSSEEPLDCLTAESSISAIPERGSVDDGRALNAENTVDSHWMRYVEEADRLVLSLRGPRVDSIR